MTATKRSKVAKNPLCRGCPALCCKDLVMPIDKPKTPDDIEELKWHIQYDIVSVFVRSHRWYLLIEAKCTYLSKDNLCKIYDKRPARCRELAPSHCERHGQFYDVMIRTPEALEKYLAGKRRRSRRTRPKG